MKVVISGNGATSDLGTIIMNHKVRLGNKYAFLFNKEIIGKAKSNLFSKPPKRIIERDLDSKLEEEANTSTSSGESKEQIVRQNHVKLAIASAEMQQSSSTTKLVEDLLSFEEFLATAGIASFESVREIRKFTRFLIANALTRKEEFRSLTRESISLAVILLAAERFELDMVKILDFMLLNTQIRRVNKMAKVREMRSYSLLTAIVESYDSMPSSP